MGAKGAFRCAVIADAHYHSLESDFDFAGFSADAGRLVMRPLGDIARAPRVYNEASAALAHALDRVVDDGIGDVVLLGDYSDDGQAETMDRLGALLDTYRNRGLRFYAVPGNHDIFGNNGRHRRKRFLNDQGGVTLVTSDPAFEPERGAGRIVSARMYCAGYPENLPADCGFFGAAQALHWETPYGKSPEPEHRTLEIRSPDGMRSRRLMDASYLVEPHPGVWFLMIDANVFVPLDAGEGGDDGLADSTSAGWNALLRHRPALLAWIADVAARARALGKALVAFSHYPVLDPLDGTVEAERAMMVPNGFHARIPPPAVAEALHRAGIRLHFSGHVHVNDTASWAAADSSQLVNVAVPALVSYPAALKTLEIEGSRVRIRTVSLDAMPLDPVLMEAYEREHALTGIDTGRMRQARSYGDFLSAHLEHLVGRRFLKREWPADMADLFRLSDLEQLIRLSGAEPEPALPSAAREISGLTVLADWYCFRNGSGLAQRQVPAARRQLYRAFASIHPTAGAADDLAQRLRLFFWSFHRHLAAPVMEEIAIDTADGRAEAATPSGA